MKRGEQLDAIWLFTRTNLFGGINFRGTCNDFVYVFRRSSRGHWGWSTNF